jgi:hypothetical protein
MLPACRWLLQTWWNSSELVADHLDFLVLKLLPATAVHQRSDTSYEARVLLQDLVMHHVGADDKVLALLKECLGGCSPGSASSSTQRDDDAAASGSSSTATTTTCWDAVHAVVAALARVCSHDANDDVEEDEDWEEERRPVASELAAQALPVLVEALLAACRSCVSPASGAGSEPASSTASRRDSTSEQSASTSSLPQVGSSTEATELDAAASGHASSSSSSSSGSPELGEPEQPPSLAPLCSLDAAACSAEQQKQQQVLSHLAPLLLALQPGDADHKAVEAAVRCMAVPALRTAALAALSGVLESGHDYCASLVLASQVGASCCHVAVWLHGGVAHDEWTT